MKCYDPSSQIFELKDKVISIEHSKNGDHTVEVHVEINKDGTLKVSSVNQLEN